MPDTPSRAEVDQLRAEVAALRRRLDRPRRRRALLPALCLALMVALVPLGLLAANPFNDLTGGVHDANIDAIYTAGVTKGCVPDVSYCPTANVTREEMASFLARLGGLGANPAVANAKTALTATSATHATTADTAADATQLGGHPAGSYARADQFQARFILGGAGPLPKTSGQFTTGGGTLVFLLSGSLYRAAAGPLALRLRLDPTVGVPTVGILGYGYTNEGASHKALVTVPLIIQAAPAGTYTVTLSAFDATDLSDATDYFFVTLLELPAP